MRGLLTLLLFLPLEANAADRLRGTWQCDHEETMRFVKVHTLLDGAKKDSDDGLRELNFREYLRRVE